METKDRLERVATVLTATADSPSLDLREMGLRLLANGPPQCPVSRICDEPAERVRRIMGGE
jgi:hypothetical protein